MDELAGEGESLMEKLEGKVGPLETERIARMAKPKVVMES